MYKLLLTFLIASTMMISNVYAEKSAAKIEIEKKQAEEKKLEFKPFPKKHAIDEEKIKKEEESARKDELIPFKDSPESKEG